MGASDDTPGQDFLTDKASADALGRMAANRAIRANQSELFRWFAKYHAEFAAVIDGVTRPGWLPIVMELHRLGIAKADGSPLSPEYVRRTWWKVRAHRARIARKEAAHDTSPPPKPALNRKASSPPAKQAASYDLSPLPEEDEEEPFVLMFGDGTTKTIMIKR